jgi:hypothetical protein
MEPLLKRVDHQLFGGLLVSLLLLDLVAVLSTTKESVQRLKVENAIFTLDLSTKRPLHEQ